MQLIGHRKEQEKHGQTGALALVPLNEILFDMWYFGKWGSDEASGLSSLGTERGCDLIPSCHTGKVDQIKPRRPPGRVYGDKNKNKPVGTVLWESRNGLNPDRWGANSWNKMKPGKRHIRPVCGIGAARIHRAGIHYPLPVKELFYTYFPEDCARRKSDVMLQLV